MVEHEWAKKDDMHNMHDEHSGERKLEVHVDPMMVEGEKPSLGPTIDDE